MYGFDYLDSFNKLNKMNAFMRSMDLFADSEQKTKYRYHLNSFKRDVKNLLKSEFPDDQDKADAIAAEVIHAYEKMAAPFDNFTMNNDLLHEASIANREREFIDRISSILEKELPLERRMTSEVLIAILDVAKVDYYMNVGMVARNDFSIVDFIESNEIMAFVSRDGFATFENNGSDAELKEQIARNEALCLYVTKRGYKQLLESEAVLPAFPLSMTGYWVMRRHDSGAYD